MFSFAIFVQSIIHCWLTLQYWNKWNDHSMSLVRNLCLWSEWVRRHYYSTAPLNIKCNCIFIKSTGTTQCLKQTHGKIQWHESDITMSMGMQLANVRWNAALLIVAQQKTISQSWPLCWQHRVTSKQCSLLAMSEQITIRLKTQVVSIVPYVITLAIVS